MRLKRLLALAWPKRTRAERRRRLPLPCSKLARDSRANRGSRTKSFLAQAGASITLGARQIEAQTVMTKLPDDPTLDEVRAYVAPLLPAHAVFDGWTSAALVSAARETGLDSQMLELAFPGGATDMINAWFESLDEALTQAIPAQTLSEIKMRDRIAALVQARLDMMKMHREALRRAQSLLALPQNLGKAAKYGWRTAARIWRLAGDHWTDRPEERRVGKECVSTCRHRREP